MHKIMNNLKSRLSVIALKNKKARSTKMNINNRLIEELADKKVSLTREELNVNIAYKRLLEEEVYKPTGKILTEVEADKLAEAEDVEFEAFFSKILKTVYNGLNTSISMSNNNSSFNNNAEIKLKYKLVKKDNKFSIETLK